jgi:polar amino acid transport system permease protein
VAFWYLFIVTAMSLAQHFLERHYGRSDRREDNLLDRIWRGGLRWRRA